MPNNWQEWRRGSYIPLNSNKNLVSNLQNMNVEDKLLDTGPGLVKKEDPSAIHILLALLAVYLIWGSTYLGIKFALSSFPPLLLGGIRFLIAGSVLYIWLRFQGHSKPTREQWLSCALVGALLLLIGNGGVGFAEQNVASSLVALVIAATPLWAAIFLSLMGRKPGKLEWIGLTIGFLGVALLNLDGQLRSEPISAAIVIASSICWSFGSVISQRLSIPSGLMASACEMLTGGALMLLIGLILGEKISLPITFEASVAIIYLTMIGSLVGFTAYSFLLENVRPSLATSYAYVNPIVAVILGAFIGNEHISPMIIVSMPLIILGIAIVVMTKSPSMEKEA